MHIQLINAEGIIIDEIKVNEDESPLHAISESLWCLDVGDTIKIIADK